MRQSYVIQAELEAAELDLKSLYRRVDNLKRELNDAKVAEFSHPWMGKRVFRQLKKGFGSRGRMVQQFGTVTAFDKTKHANIRGGPYADPGDPIVVSDSGKSAWRLKGYSSHDPDFELDGGPGLPKRDK